MLIALLVVTAILLFLILFALVPDLVESLVKVVAWLLSVVLVIALGLIVWAWWPEWTEDMTGVAIVLAALGVYIFAVDRIYMYFKRKKQSREAQKHEGVTRRRRG